ASKVGRPLLGTHFQWNAAKLASSLAKGHPRAVVHVTAPISPVLPSFRVPHAAAVVVGPINGNIHHPEAFRSRESASDKLRWIAHGPAQFGHRALFRGKQSADVILVAGGERTYRSLRLAGCRDGQFVDSLDAGIQPELFDLPRAEHKGRNLRFVHSGRLVPYKGTDLAIRAVAAAKLPVTLDIIGKGPQFEPLKQLAQRLNVADRVNFVGWVPHDQMATTLQQYRAFVFPTLAEANGIVIQEAMALGVPVVTLDWGGPALLVTPETGVLVRAENEAQVVTDVAAAMDRLADDGDRADRMSAAARQRAVDEGYPWPQVVQKWLKLYEDAIVRRANQR
ncbi:MAG TPA: glycosyltransferase family 4 protein, partial [Tepidisphaeraceae bacterium]|nr:glycosyltransferase family 4 protein [Tepidisphaeraceae bacterium]